MGSPQRVENNDQIVGKAEEASWLPPRSTIHVSSQGEQAVHVGTGRSTARNGAEGVPCVHKAELRGTAHILFLPIRRGQERHQGSGEAIVPVAEEVLAAV